MSPSPYLVKITLQKTPKLIWRRVVVPSNIRLDRLHEILQTVMGWSEPRPHVFFHKKQGFYPIGQIPDGGISEKKYTLANHVVRSGGKLKYIHDPAEEKWIHEVVVEDIRFSDPAWPFPICCIAGVRACPPSGIGGADGFAHLLRVLDGKAEDTELKSRFGDFQPNHFDLESVNRTFGVDGPRHIVQKAFEPPSPKKADRFPSERSLLSPRSKVEKAVPKRRRMNKKRKKPRKTHLTSYGAFSMEQIFGIITESITPYHF